MYQLFKGILKTINSKNTFYLVFEAKKFKNMNIKNITIVIKMWKLSLRKNDYESFGTLPKQRDRTKYEEAVFLLLALCSSINTYRIIRFANIPTKAKRP